jgi:tetratricopeptide (TPR) repeat protein
LEALQLAEAALAKIPDDIALLNAAATSARSAGLPEPAERYWQQAVAQNPQYVEGYYNLGVLFSELKRNAEAENSYRQALAIDPQYASAYNNLAILLQNMQRLEEAEANYRSALKVNADYVDALYNLGVLLQEQQRYEEAHTCYQRVVAINPAHSGALNNRGVMLQAQRRYEEADAAYLEVLARDPQYAEAHRNRGYLLQQMKRFDEAETCYRTSLALKPDYADADWGLGMLLLYLGRFEEGWQRYESRYHPAIQKRTIHPPEISIPQWKGETLAGKRIAVWSEQALGDDFQLCRYLPELKKLGAAHVTFVCKAALKPLLQRLDGVDALLTREEGGDFSSYDYWSLLFSLPLHCKTTLDSVPNTIPYLSAKPDYLQPIAATLEQASGLKIGVCWKGSVLYMANADRSPGIQAFAKLFKIPGARFFTLLPDSRSEFLPVAGAAAVDLGHEIDSDTPPFEETAALISALDLIITSDTSIAHVAGALGKPVWMVLPYVADWRWMDEGEDTPWYPNMRLFRQTQRGDWPSVFERVIARLQQVISGNSALLWPVQNHYPHYQAPLPKTEEPRQKAALLASKGILPTSELFQAAERLEQENQTDVAAELYRTWLNNTPLLENPAVYFNIGLALERAGDATGAEQAYQTALKQQANFIPAHINLALLLQHQERLDDALAQWRRLFKLNLALLLENKSNYILALNNFGLFLEQYFRPQEAEQVFRNSLALDSNQPAVWSKLAQLQSWINIGFQVIPSAEYASTQTLGEESIARFFLAHDGTPAELPSQIKVIKGEVNAHTISPNGEISQPSQLELKAIFAIKDYLEANPHCERVALFSDKKLLVPLPAPRQKPQPLTEIAQSYAGHELMIERPVNLVQQGLDNALQYYCQQHRLETILRFLTEGVAETVLEAHEVCEILNAKLWIPDCGTLGIYPASFYRDTATKLEKMVFAYLKKYPATHHVEQNRELAACCESIWNHFVLKHLAASYPNGLPSHCFAIASAPQH